MFASNSCGTKAKNRLLSRKYDAFFNRYAVPGPYFSFVRSDIDLAHFDSCSAVQILLSHHGWSKIGAIA